MEQTITISFTPTKIKLFGSKKKKSLLVVDGICINGSLNRILPKSPALIHIRQTSTALLPSSIDSFECLSNKLLVEGDNLSLHTQKHPTQGSWIDADKNKCVVIKVEAKIERNRKGDRLIECTEVLALQDIGDESYLPINTETNEEYNEYITNDEENDDDNVTSTNNSINRKSERHTIFAHWLVETYGKEKLSQGTGVLDVAGGNGMISRTLTEKYGIPSTLVDPNPRHETSNHDDESDEQSTATSTLFKVIPHPLNGDGSDLTSRDDEIGNIVNNCSLICGLHPDQATEPIVTLALRLGVPFAILPCCVMPSLFPHRFQKRSINQRFAVRSYSTFCQYLLDMCPENEEEFKVDHLPFVGRNKVIYRGGCNKQTRKNNNHRQQSATHKVPLLPLTLVLLVAVHHNLLVQGLSLNYPRYPSKIHSTRRSLSSIHQDEDGNCVFGKKDYWDEMYGGQQLVTDVDYYPQDAYSWYCGWEELSPFWRMLVPDLHLVLLSPGLEMIKHLSICMTMDTRI